MWIVHSYISTTNVSVAEFLEHCLGAMIFCGQALLARKNHGIPSPKVASSFTNWSILSWVPQQKKQPFGNSKKKELVVSLSDFPAFCHFCCCIVDCLTLDIIKILIYTLCLILSSNSTKFAVFIQEAEKVERIQSLFKLRPTSLLLAEGADDFISKTQP